MINRKSKNVHFSKKISNHKNLIFMVWYLLKSAILSCNFRKWKSVGFGVPDQRVLCLADSSRFRRIESAKSFYRSIVPVACSDIRRSHKYDRLWHSVQRVSTSIIMWGNKFMSNLAYILESCAETRILTRNWKDGKNFETKILSC